MTTQVPPEDPATPSSGSTVDALSRALARTPRGLILTGAVAVGAEVLLVAAGLVTARFLGPRQVALAGAVVATLAIASRLRDFAIGPRLVQMGDDPGPLYDEGFTAEVWLSIAYVALSLATAPLVAMLYGDRDLVALCAVLGLQGFAPAAVFPLVRVQRALDWHTQRMVEAVGPIGGAIVTIALAVAGAGAWAIVVGQLAITTFAGIALWTRHVARPRFRRQRVPAQTRHFLLSYGGPLWGAGLVNAVVSAVILTEIQLLTGSLVVGYARLALTIGDRIGAAETVLANLLFPVLPRLQDRAAWRRAFEVSNTLILLWAIPAGLLVTMLAGDIADHLLGARWHDAEPLLRFVGIAEIVNSVAATWVVFYAAAGRTVPQLLLSVTVGVVLVAALPLLLARFGIVGMIAALSLGVALAAAERLRRLYALLPGVGVLRSSVWLLAAGGLACAAAALIRNAAGGSAAPLIEVLVFALLYLPLAYLASRRTLPYSWRMLAKGER
jgi:O-antigen/teichoic acid export membrane protein